MSPEIEIRSTVVENRSSGRLRRIGGTGVVYGKKSRLLPGGFQEIVRKGALAKTLADKANVVSRMEHDVRFLLGTTDSGTMRLADGPDGCDYEVDLPDTVAGRDCYTLVHRGDLRSASMAFVAFQDEFSHQGSVLVRHLISIKLTEISPVSQPAYPNTDTALRSLASQFNEDPEQVFELARREELRSLFTRTDQQVTATVTVEPGIRTEEDMDRMSCRQAALELARLRGEFDAPRLSVTDAKLQLLKLNMERDAALIAYTT